MMNLLLLFCFVSETFAGTILGTGSSTFWPFLQALANSYRLIDPDFVLDFKSNSSVPLAIHGVASGDYDFALIDSYQLNYSAYAVPIQVVPFLVSAFVPQVNFAFRSNIILERSVWVDIFMGNIVNWNDSAIQATNPNITFPNATIQVMYRSDPTSAHIFLSYGFRSFNQEWNSTYGIISGAYPSNLTSLSNFIGVRGAVSLNGASSYVYNSISYANVFHIRRSPDLFYAQLIHKTTGKPIPCNGDSLEAASRTIVMDEKLQAPYAIDSPDENAWPIADYIFLAISAEPKNAAQARKFFKFVRWAISYNTSRDIIRQQGCGNLDANNAKIVVEKVGKIQTPDGETLGAWTDTYYSDWVEALFYAITMTILFLGIVLCLVHLYYFSRSKINAIYTGVFVVGTIVTLISPAFWLTRATEGICMARIWTLSLGMSTLLASMFSRTWQLNDIYTLQRKKDLDALRFKSTTNKTILQLVATLLGVVALNLCILIFWSSIDPLKPVWVVGNEVLLYGEYECQSEYASAWITVEMLFFLSLLCFGVYVIYKTWSFQRSALIKETRWVLFALYNVLLNICALIPLIAFASISPRVLRFVVVFSLELSGGSIISAVLLPRLLQIKSEHWGKGFSDSSEKKNLSGGIRIRHDTQNGTKASEKPKVEYSRTPEDVLAKRLETPEPLFRGKGNPTPSLVIDKNGVVKSFDTHEEIELSPLQAVPEHTAFGEPSPARPLDISSTAPLDEKRQLIYQHDDDLDTSVTLGETSPRSGLDPSPLGLDRATPVRQASDSETGLLQSFSAFRDSPRK